MNLKSPLCSWINKTQIFRRKTQKSIENVRLGANTPGLAPLVKSFWKYQKGNAT